MLRLCWVSGLGSIIVAAGACSSSSDSSSSSGGAAGMSDGGSGTSGSAGSGTGGSGTGGGAGAGTGGGAGAGTGGSAGAGTGGSAGASGGAGASGAAGATSCAGSECAGFSTSWVRGCTNDQSCVGELHQIDCCGAIRAMGMNHSQAGTFCAAEYGSSGVTSCRASYPASPGCSSNVITTDTGDTTTDLNKVGTKCMNITGGVGTCTTFVCGQGTCPVENGTCK